MTIDYRTLLSPAETVRASDGMMSIVIRSTDDLLATRIPRLCLDCNEYEMRWMGRVTEDGDGPYVRCTHPNAPTIADLLRWGEWVATAERTFNDDWNLWGWVVNGEWVDDADLLAALRTEADR